MDKVMQVALITGVGVKMVDSSLNGIDVHEITVKGETVHIAWDLSIEDALGVPLTLMSAQSALMWFHKREIDDLKERLRVSEEWVESLEEELVYGLGQYINNLEDGLDEFKNMSFFGRIRFAINGWMNEDIKWEQANVG